MYIHRSQAQLKKASESDLSIVQELTMHLSSEGWAPYIPHQVDMAR